MPAKKPDAPEEVTVFESIKNRIALRSQVIADLRQTVADRDEEILTLGVQVEDAQKAVTNAETMGEAAYQAQRAAEQQNNAAIAANAEMQAFVDSIKTLPEFADLFDGREYQPAPEVGNDGDQPA